MLAGCQATQKEQLTVGDRTFSVVGVLRRDAALLSNAYLLPPSESVENLFDRSDTAVRDATLVALTAQQAADHVVRQQLGRAHPRDRFTAIMADSGIRADGGPYCLYMAGLALLLCGGSGWFIGLYAALAPRAHWRPLASPLAELSHYHRLLWATHLAYFGLIIAGAMAIYCLPRVQNALLLIVHGQISGGEGVLGIVGKAYLSKNMALAAAITLLVNFVIGSLACITVPSAIIPGAGALFGRFAPLLWGILLAPSIGILAFAMLPHSWTLLIEGEAYIVAAFFALQVPNYLCRPSLGGGVLHRYGRALLINAQGALLTFIILAAAACYEAVEVILMRP